MLAEWYVSDNVHKIYAELPLGHVGSINCLVKNGRQPSEFNGTQFDFESVEQTPEPERGGWPLTRDLIARAKQVAAMQPQIRPVRKYLFNDQAFTWRQLVERARRDEDDFINGRIMEKTELHRRMINAGTDGNFATRGQYEAVFRLAGKDGRVHLYNCVRPEDVHGGWGGNPGGLPEGQRALTDDE